MGLFDPPSRTMTRDQGDIYREKADRLADETRQLYGHGRLSDAEERVRELINLQARVVGERHPEYATGLCMLAAILSSQDELTDAETLLERASEIRKRTLGETHPDYAAGLDQHARLLIRWQDYDAAEPLLRQALAIREPALGRKHADFASSLSALAQVLFAKGDLDQAEPMLREALSSLRESLGSSDPAVADTLCELAEVQQRLNRFADAEALLREAIETYRSQLGEKDPRHLASLIALAALLQKKGDLESAEPIWRLLLDMKRTAQGGRDASCVPILIQLGALLQRKGDLKAAETQYRQAVEVAKEALGDRHPEYAMCLTSLATLLQRTGDLNAAEPLFRQALAVRKEVLGQRHPEYATSLLNLAQLVQKRGDATWARMLLKEAVEVRRAVFGEQHPEYALSLAALADIHAQQGDLAKAEALLFQALDIRRQAYGEMHPIYAANLSSIAGILRRQGEFEGAETLLRQSLDIRHATLGEQHPDYATNLGNLAWLLQNRGDAAGAEALLAESLELRRKLVGENHPEYKQNFERLQALRLVISQSPPPIVEPSPEPSAVHDSAQAPSSIDGVIPTEPEGVSAPSLAQADAESMPTLEEYEGILTVTSYISREQAESLASGLIPEPLPDESKAPYHEPNPHPKPVAAHTPDSLAPSLDDFISDLFNEGEETTEPDKPTDLPTFGETVLSPNPTEDPVPLAVQAETLEPITSLPVSIEPIIPVADLEPAVFEPVDKHEDPIRSAPNESESIEATNPPLAQDSDSPPPPFEMESCQIEPIANEPIDPPAMPFCPESSISHEPTCEIEPEPKSEPIVAECLTIEETPASIHKFEPATLSDVPFEAEGLNTDASPKEDEAMVAEPSGMEECTEEGSADRVTEEVPAAVDSHLANHEETPESLASSKEETPVSSEPPVEAVHQFEDHKIPAEPELIHAFTAPTAGPLEDSPKLGARSAEGAEPLWSLAMSQSSSHYSQELSGMSDRFSDLGERLLAAARHLHAPGTPPSDELLEALGQCRREFLSLRDRTFDLAGSLHVDCPNRDAIHSLQDLTSVLDHVAEAEIHQSKSEELRRRSVSVLDRVLNLSHASIPDFAPLMEAHNQARGLRESIAGGAWKNLPAEASRLAEGEHHFSDLLTLIQDRDELSDDLWATLHENVAQAFGKSLAAAAARAKLTLSSSGPHDEPALASQGGFNHQMSH